MRFCCTVAVLLLAASRAPAQPPMQALQPSLVTESQHSTPFPSGIELLPPVVEETWPVAPASGYYAESVHAAGAGAAIENLAPPPHEGGDCPCCLCAPCQCPCPPAECLPCPRVNLLNPCWQMLVGGALTMDAMSHSARPIAPGTPFFLTPGGPFEDDTFDIHGRGTTMYFALVGPEVGNFRAGGLIAFALYNDAIVVDRYGFLPYMGYGELKNETWRIAGGLQADIFAPVLPNVLPFSFLMASGNAGVFRGQLRAERYLYPAEDEQVTLTAGISDADPTIVNNNTLSEDNGWPNVELRAAWAVGEPQQVGLAAQRPFEVGVSAVVGELRTRILGPALDRVVADVWGLAGDIRWRVNDFWGFQGELFTGQGLGTYAGGVFQSVNTANFDAVHATGGWGEVYCYLTPCLHTHAGYAFDDPANGDLATGQITRNETFFTNVIWDATQNFRLGFEITYRETNYLALNSNDGIGLHGQMQWKF